MRILVGHGRLSKPLGPAIAARMLAAVFGCLAFVGVVQPRSERKHATTLTLVLAVQVTGAWLWNVLSPLLVTAVAAPIRTSLVWLLFFLVRLAVACLTRLEQALRWPMLLPLFNAALVATVPGPHPEL